MCVPWEWGTESPSRFQPSRNTIEQKWCETDRFFAGVPKIPNKKKDSFKKDNIMKDQFHYHVNTIQLKRMPHMITPDSLIQISIKTNGSSGISANLKVKRPLHQSLFDKILKRKKYKEEYYTFFASRSMIQDSVIRRNRRI